MAWGLGRDSFLRRHRFCLVLLYIAVMATVSVVLQVLVGGSLHDWIYR